MGEAKLRIKIGDLEFEGEGDSAWLTERLDALIEKAPGLLGAPKPAQQQQPSGGPPHHPAMEPDPAIATKPLGTFLREKRVDTNQTKKFLATAVWLESKGQNRLKPGDVTKALNENSQSKLGNPSQCLIENVKQGYCERDKKQFYVTPQGKESLETSGAQTGDS
jgi:hypothetical protein